MTQANILVGWKSTGLYPFNPTRLILVIEIPSTPVIGGTPQRMQAPLGSLIEENRNFMDRYGPSMTSPVKRYVSKLITGLQDD